MLYSPERRYWYDRTDDRILFLTTFIWRSFIHRLQKAHVQLPVIKEKQKSAKKIHQAQSRSDRFSFRYVKDYTPYQKEFRFFHGFYMVNLYFTPFQYLAVIVFNFISLKITFILQIIFFVIKLICHFILRTQQNSNRIFRFDKRYQ
jgi:hypothetical protein